MLINGRYKKVGKLGDGSYGDVFKCIDYFPTAESRLLPQSTVDLIRSVEKGDVLTDSDDFEDNFTDLFSENDKFMNSSEVIYISLILNQNINTFTFGYILTIIQSFEFRARNRYENYF